MKKIKFTRKELEEFDDLVTQSELKGFDNYARNIGRLRLNAFVEKHGKAKCDAMWEIIKDWK
jgi:hypothetical protein